MSSEHNNTDPLLMTGTLWQRCGDSITCSVTFIQQTLILCCPCRTPSLPVLPHGCGRLSGLVHRPVELLPGAIPVRGSQGRASGRLCQHNLNEEKPFLVAAPFHLALPVALFPCDMKHILSYYFRSLGKENASVEHFHKLVFNFICIVLFRNKRSLHAEQV